MLCYASVVWCVMLNPALRATVLSKCTSFSNIPVDFHSSLGRERHQNLEALKEEVLDHEPREHPPWQHLGGTCVEVVS